MEPQARGWVRHAQNGGTVERGRGGGSWGEGEWVDACIKLHVNINMNAKSNRKPQESPIQRSEANYSDTKTLKRKAVFGCHRLSAVKTNRHTDQTKVLKANEAGFLSGLNWGKAES